MTMLRIEVPATSANLGPGFDTFGLALGLCNVVTVDLDPAGDQVTLESVSGEDIGTFDPSDNLLCDAYRAWGETFNTPLPGARFQLESRIPVGKGLGSSAGAIVAGLAAAARASGETQPREKLVSLSSALEGHPDNAVAAVLGGATVAYMDEQGTHALQIVTHLGVGVALYVPDIPLLTSDARAVLPDTVSLRDAVSNVSRASYLATALAWGRWELIGPAMTDRLHQPYRARLIPALDPTIEAARAAGAFGAALSGGGPAVLALTPLDRVDTVMAAMTAAAHERGWAGHGLVTNVRHIGVQVTEATGEGGESPVS